MPGEISITPDTQMTPLMVESEEDLKSLLMKVTEESEKAGLKLYIQKTKIMASSLIMANRWGKMETVTDFIFLDSNIIVDGYCSHEIKRLLLLGSKAMTNLDSILKSRARTNNFTICMEIQKTSNSQSNLEKEEWNWRNQPT